MPARPKVSIILPLLNEEAFLDELLEKLCKQMAVDDEIIAVEAGSTDATPKILMSWTKKEPRLRYISAPGSLPGRSRNIGIAAATGEIIVQVDGGCDICSNWLTKILEPIENDTADYVSGAIQLLPSPTIWFGMKHDRIALFQTLSDWTIRSADVIAGGAAVAYRRWIWERVGGFPEFMRTCEDVYFAMRVKKLGVRHTYAADAVCRWQIGPNFSDVVRRKYRYLKNTMRMAVLPDYVRSLIIRSCISYALLCAAFITETIGFFMFIGATVTYTGWRTVKMTRRYTQWPAKDRLPVVFFFIIAPILSLMWFIVEEAAFISGLLSRITQRTTLELSRQYLLKPLSTGIK